MSDFTTIRAQLDELEKRLARPDMTPEWRLAVAGLLKSFDARLDPLTSETLPDLPIA